MILFKSDTKEHVLQKLVSLVLMWSAILFFSGFICASENNLDSKSRPEIEIIQALQKWPQDFNSKHIKEVCGLFAPDLIASYPGTKDRNYEEMCHKLTASLSDSDKSFRYDAPAIEQIIIEGDLAVVRLIWTLTISYKDQQEIIKEKGLDVFQRQKDGTWKIAVSYAYPMIKDDG